MILYTSLPVNIEIFCSNFSIFSNICSVSDLSSNFNFVSSEILIFTFSLPISVEPIYCKLLLFFSENAVSKFLFFLLT